MTHTTPIVADQVLLTVDYGQSLPQMIAAGRYGWISSDITSKRFPIQGTGIVLIEARLVHFHRVISSADAVAAATGDSLENPRQPANIEHLLSFGAAYPDEQRKYPIMALGSVTEVVSFRRVSFLRRGESERDLGLIWWDNDRPGDYRFLAVRTRFWFSGA